MSAQQTKTVGTTYAEAEYAAYENKALARDTLARIRREEEKHGYKTGHRHVRDADGSMREIRVSVSFYPSVRFYISDVVDGVPVNARELTDEEYSPSYGLLL